MEVNSMKLFLSNFSKNSPTSEDLPQARVVNYSLNLEDIPGQVIDWVISYLENRKCPNPLALAIAKETAHHISASFADIACNATEEELEKYSTASNMYAGTIGKIPEICSSFLEKGDLDILCSNIHATSVFAIKNKRRKMEDRHVVIPDLNSLLDLKDLPLHSYYAVFDGHSGSDAACYAAAQLHVNIAKHPDFMIDTPKAIIEAYQITDLNFLNKCNKGNIKSGCTALCALIRASQVYLSWLGDSLAVLVKQGVPSILTNPHKPDREDERLRIEKLGGHITHVGTWRVGGLLAVSRAIGDPDQKRFISSEPELVMLNLEGTEDFLILACDGLWDGMSPEDATAVLYRYFLDNPPDEPLDTVAAKLVHQSKLQGSEDNITAIVIFLKDAKDIRENAANFLKNSNAIIGDQDFLSLNGNIKSPGSDVQLSKPTILELNATSTKKLKNSANVMSSAGFGSSSFSYPDPEIIMESSVHNLEYLLEDDQNTFISQQKISASYVAPEATALSELPTPPIDDILASQQDDNFYATDLYKEIKSAENLNSADLHSSTNKHNLSNTDPLSPHLSDNFSKMSLYDAQASPNSSNSIISPEEAVEIASTVVSTTVETAVKCLTEESSELSPVSQLNPYAKPFVMKSFFCPEENLIKTDETPVLPDCGVIDTSEDNRLSSGNIAVNPTEPAFIPENLLSSMLKPCSQDSSSAEQTNQFVENTDVLKIKQVEICGSSEPESGVLHEELLSLASQTCSNDNLSLCPTINQSFDKIDCTNFNQVECCTPLNEPVLIGLPEELSSLPETCSENYDFRDVINQSHDKIDSTNLVKNNHIQQYILTEELSSSAFENHSEAVESKTSSLKTYQNPKSEFHVDDLASITSDQYVDSLRITESSDLLKKDIDENVSDKNKDLPQMCNDLLFNSNEINVEKKTELNFNEKLFTSEIHSQDIMLEANTSDFCQNSTAQIHTNETPGDAANYVSNQDTNDLLLKDRNEVICNDSNKMCEVLMSNNETNVKTKTEAGISEQSSVEKENSISSKSTTKTFSLATTGNEILSISAEIPSDSQVEPVAVDLKCLPENIPEAEGVTEDADSDSEKDGGWSYVKGNIVSSSKTKSAEKKLKTVKSSLQKNITAANFKKDILKSNVDSKNKVKSSPIDKAKGMPSNKTRTATLTDKIKTAVPEKTKSTTSADTIKKATIDKKMDLRPKVSKFSTLIDTKTTHDKIGKKNSAKTENTDIPSKTTIQKSRPTTLLHTNKTATKVSESVPAKFKVNSTLSENKTSIKSVASNTATSSTQNKAAAATTNGNIKNQAPTVPSKTLRATTKRTVSSRPLTTTIPNKTAQATTSTVTNCPPKSAPCKKPAVSASAMRHATQRPATTLPSRLTAKPRPASAEPRPRMPTNMPISTLKKLDVKDVKNDVNKQLSAKRKPVSTKTESGSTVTSKRVIMVNNKSTGSKASGSAIKSEISKQGMSKVPESKTIKKTGSKVAELGSNVKSKSQNKEENLNNLNIELDQKVSTEIIQSAEEKFILETSDKEIATNEVNILNQNTANEIMVQVAEEKFILETSSKEIVSNEERILDLEEVNRINQGLEAGFLLETNIKEIEAKEKSDDCRPVTENGCLPEFQNAASSPANL